MIGDKENLGKKAVIGEQGKRVGIKRQRLGVRARG